MSHHHKHKSKHAKTPSKRAYKRIMLEHIEQEIISEKLVIDNLDNKEYFHFAFQFTMNSEDDKNIEQKLKRKIAKILNKMREKRNIVVMQFDYNYEDKKSLNMDGYGSSVDNEYSHMALEHSEENTNPYTKQVEFWKDKCKNIGILLDSKKSVVIEGKHDPNATLTYNSSQIQNDYNEYKNTDQMKDSYNSPNGMQYSPEITGFIGGTI